MVIQLHTTHYLPEGYVLRVELYLILSDDQTDANLTTVECDLPEEVNISNEQKQAYLDCKIVDLDKDEEYKSFEIKQIAGIPEDKTLSDKTAEAISNGQQLLDYSDEDNKYTYPAYFSAYEMNPAVTEEGKFTIHGYLNKEEGVEFTLHSTFPP